MLGGRRGVAVPAVASRASLEAVLAVSRPRGPGRKLADRRERMGSTRWVVLVACATLSVGCKCTEKATELLMTEELAIDEDCISRRGDTFVVTGGPFPARRKPHRVPKRFTAWLEPGRGGKEIPVEITSLTTWEAHCTSPELPEAGDYTLFLALCREKDGEREQSLYPVLAYDGELEVTDIDPYWCEEAGGCWVTISGTFDPPENLEITVEPANTPFFKTYEATATEIQGSVAPHCCFEIDTWYDVRVSRTDPETGCTLSDTGSFLYTQEECPCPTLEELPGDLPGSAVVAIGNVNRGEVDELGELDAFEDLVVAHTDRAPLVWLGTGEPAPDCLPPGPSFELDRAGYSTATDIVVEDLTADGFDDVAIAYDDEAVVVYVQGTDGTLLDPIVLSESATESIAAGDHDGDGVKDLALLPGATDARLRVLYDGSALATEGEFGRPWPWGESYSETTWPGATSLAFGEPGHDGQRLFLACDENDVRTVDEYSPGRIVVVSAHSPPVVTVDAISPPTARLAVSYPDTVLGYKVLLGGEGGLNLFEWISGETSIMAGAAEASFLEARKFRPDARQRQLAYTRTTRGGLGTAHSILVIMDPPTIAEPRTRYYDVAGGAVTDMAVGKLDDDVYPDIVLGVEGAKVQIYYSTRKDEIWGDPIE
jgi:hypothetical protein